MRGCWRGWKGAETAPPPPWPAAVLSVGRLGTAAAPGEHSYSWRINKCMLNLCGRILTRYVHMNTGGRILTMFEYMWKKTDYVLVQVEEY